MKQASAAAVHRQVFSEVRGKHTARVGDSDVNTVYLSAVCVHTDFPRRPLSEPGCRPPERLKGSAGLFELCCGISSRQLFWSNTHTPSVKVSNLYSKKAGHYRSGILTRHQTARV